MDSNLLRSYALRPINVITLCVPIVLGILLMPMLAFAEEAAATPEFADFWSALAANNWPLAVGIGLTILVWVVRNFKVLDRVPKNALPWVSLAVAVFGTTGTRIVQFCAEGKTWWHGMIEGVVEGLSMGFISMGMWDTKQTMVRRQNK